MSTQPKTFLTPEEYLAIERAAETKSEYFNGEMFAKAGADYVHNLLTLNCGAGLWQRFRSGNRKCRTYVSDMRVHTPSGLYTYPDVIVTCEAPVFLDDTRDTLLNPKLIVEVQSPSTEAYDRGKKFELYRGIPSLREYLMLASERVHAELYTLEANRRWALAEFFRLEDEIELASCDCRLQLADVYEQVEF